MSTPDPRPQDAPDTSLREEIAQALTTAPFPGMRAYAKAETVLAIVEAAFAERERRVRERVAAEIEAQKTGCKAPPDAAAAPVLLDLWTRRSLPPRRPDSAG